MSTTGRGERDDERAGSLALVGAGVPVVDYGELRAHPGETRDEPDRPSGRGRPVLALLAVALVVLGVLLAGLLTAVPEVGGAHEDSTIEHVIPPGRPPLAPLDVLSTAGYVEMVEGVREATGSTMAFEAAIYPENAVLRLPVDASSQRHSSWYWDGVIDRLDVDGTSTEARVDLGEIDPAVVVRLVARARGHLGTPATYYAIVRAPDADGAAIWAHARNEYTQSGYISATLDGKVVRNTFTDQD